MRVALVILLAAGLAGFTYLRLERTGRRGWIPMGCRAVAWGALGLLLLNLSCPAHGAPQRPLVLLDASLSLSAPGGRWAEARDSAQRWGEVRRFGDERVSSDSLPSRGRSLLAPALLAASVSGRPVIVVTDGEIEDAADLPPDLLAGSGIRVFPRRPRPDLAVTSLSGPARVTAGDSIPLDFRVEAVGDSAPDTVAIEVTAGSTRLASRTIRLRNGAGQGHVVLPSGSIAPGDHLLRVALTRWTDAEPRTDARLHLVSVAPTPGVVLLAGAADWDSRFLYRTLREVAQLPVRGYVQLDAERWRTMTDLAPVSTEQVRQAARRADLLILKGVVGGLAEGSVARGIWSWPGGQGRDSAVAGDWYLTPADASPLAGAFLGQPVDSFPPAIQLWAFPASPGAWVALNAQLGRRGTPRPAVLGWESGRVRRVGVAVDGLWRWAFRGGSSEQSYRALIAAAASWLLGGVDTTRGAARAVRSVVPNGRPVIFEWVGPGAATPLGITWPGSKGQRADTLRFDGSGRAVVWLVPGEYSYRLAGGGGGTVAVEQYSDELLPHPVTLASRNPRVVEPAGRTAARDWLWLFGLCVAALSAEWFARRRLGLR
jgi:hypothetical protein